MQFKIVGDSPFNQWRPVRPAYMERFKDRAWRLFGIKVPLERRPEIRARFERRKKEWNRRKYGGLIGSVLRKHEKAFVDSIMNDCILLRALKREDYGGSMIVPFKRKEPGPVLVGADPAFSRVMVFNGDLLSRPIMIPDHLGVRIRELAAEARGGRIEIEYERRDESHMMDALRYATMVHDRQRKKLKKSWWRRAWGWVREILQGGRKWVSIVKTRIQGKTG